MMSSSPTNLLIQLRRWANRQDENFTTDAFVHLLNHLVTFQPSAAMRVLTHLTGNRIPEQASIPLEVG